MPNNMYIMKYQNATNTQAHAISPSASLGKDGYFRSISVVATEDLWEQNEEIFEKILSSLNSV